MKNTELENNEKMQNGSSVATSYGRASGYDFSKKLPGHSWLATAPGSEFSVKFGERLKMSLVISW